MCENCERGKRPIEVTEETAPRMLRECAIVALHACTFCTSGWDRAAEGLLLDMREKWGPPGVLRICYVWAAARAFLPRPADAPPLEAGCSDVQTKLARLTGEVPQQQRVTHIVMTTDQALAVIRTLTENASTGDLPAFARTLTEIADTHLWNTAMKMLKSDAGHRVRHARSQRDPSSMKRLMALVNNMPSEGGDPSGAQAYGARDAGPGGAGDDAGD